MMKIMVRIAVAYAILCAQTANAQPTIAQLRTDLVSTWIVKVDGESRTRTLRIKGIEQKTADAFLLDAEYGWSDGRQTSVNAEVNQNSQDIKLTLLTQSDSKIVATKNANGVFTGTFTLKNGTTKGISLQKVSDEELRSQVNTALNAMPAIEKPTADVPASCALFLGGWSGPWPDIGRVWLWVVSVDAKCVAKYAYSTSSGVPKEFKTAEIKEGILILPRPKGTSYFELRGDELAGRYSGSDGNNSGNMQKVSLSGGTVAKLRSEQKASETVSITPPAADVPAPCAAFYGGWSGTWSQGNFGAQWLRVVAVDVNCIAKLSYRDSKAIPKVFQTAEIKNGGKGADLWGNYSNSSGGSNNGVFRKVD